VIVLDARRIAVSLGGELSGRDSILCPGPGHSPQDRSLSVALDPNASGGFLTHSFAGDDWRACRDYVRERLGLPLETGPRRAREARQRPSQPQREGDDHAKKIAEALSLWAEGVDPRPTIVKTYLCLRRLELDDEIAGRVLRWHAGIGAMLALFRSVETDEPRAISRTFLDRDGRKLGRKFLGPVRGAAVKLDADENVLGGLHIGEGVETCMSARQLGLRPAWALGSAGAVEAFHVLGGIESLTLLAEHDCASASAVEACAARSHGAGREVLIDQALVGKDLNDALRGAS
jgi:hypothetical protein